MRLVAAAALSLVLACTALKGTFARMANQAIAAGPR
jgi:hypothetical protein